MHLSPHSRCYVDGEPCDCDAFDVANDCPRDPYAHEEDDLEMEDQIEAEYYANHLGAHDDEIERF